MQVNDNTQWTCSFLHLSPEFVCHFLCSNREAAVKVVIYSVPVKTVFVLFNTFDLFRQFIFRAPTKLVVFCILLFYAKILQKKIESRIVSSKIESKGGA